MIHYSQVTPEQLLNSEVSLSDIKPLTQDDITLKFSKGLKHKIPTWYCFILYWLTGSSPKAEIYLKNLGITNRFGTFYKAVTVLIGAWEWVLLNPEKAKPFVKRDYDVIGDEFTDEKYYLYLVGKVATYRQIFTDKQSIKWIEDNQLTDEFYLRELKLKRPEVYKHFKSANYSPV